MAEGEANQGQKIQSLYSANDYTQRALSTQWSAKREGRSDPQSVVVSQLKRMDRSDGVEALLAQLLRKLPHTEHLRLCVSHLGDCLLPSVMDQDSKGVVG